jgi:hypothetical protein
VLRDARAERLQAECLEVRRWRQRPLFAREVRLHEALDALEGHFFRQTVRVRLERVRRVHAMGEDLAPALHHPQLVRQEIVNQRPHFWVAQVEQMPGAIEPEPLVIHRHGVAPNAGRPLDVADGQVAFPKVQRGRQAREPGAEDEHVGVGSRAIDRARRGEIRRGRRHEERKGRKAGGQ